MKAFFTDRKTTFNRNHRKEKGGFIGTYVAVSPKGGIVVEARFYWPGESVCYCCLWVHGDEYRSGSGKATGYGYHHPSEALEQAIKAAGIDLERDDRSGYIPIGGTGEGSMIEALNAIATTCGYADTKVYHFHA